MLLSVIVPFYGVEKYLPECLSGLEGLPASQCEILLVDDCGTDGSLRIAETWADKRNNVQLIRRKQNGGLSAARNTGLAAAKGEYVFFLDSDDIPLASGILELAEYGRENGLDIVKGNFRYLDDETGRESPGLQLDQSEIVPGSVLFTDECRNGSYEPMVWQCVYRRTFLAEHRLAMAESMLFEDELFQTPALLKADRAGAIPAMLLKYRQRPGSIMRSFSGNTRWCSCYLEICRRLSALADSGTGEAAAALRTRVSQIALSVGKNIAAYRLEGTVLEEAMSFLKENKREIAAIACRSRSFAIRLQASLLFISPSLFVRLYSLLKR